MNFRIPDSWVGGVNESGERIVKTVRFRACQPTTKVSTPGSMVAQADGSEEEGIEYSAPLAQVPIEAVPIELYEYDHMSHEDAPMRLLGESDMKDAEAQPSKGGSDKRSVQTLPQTGDVGGLGIGTALSAAAGAALVAYGRRRAENERG